MEPGKHTSIRVKQVQHVATTRFMDHDLQSRQCRFSNENPGFLKVLKLLTTSFAIFVSTDEHSIFKKYSQAGCIFECSLNFAIASVECVPWDFPVPFKWQDVQLAICTSINQDPTNDKNKLVLFHEAMNNDSNLRTCDCMPDCEATIYDTQGDHRFHLCHMDFITYFLLYRYPLSLSLPIYYAKRTKQPTTWPKMPC